MTFNDRLKDYEPVEERLARFYQEHSQGRVLTEIAHHSEDFAFVVFKATVFRSVEDAGPSATGFAFEKAGSSPVNRTSHIENCETSAIGRALANLGYAAKGKRASREEMTKVSAGSATTPTGNTEPSATPVAPQPEVSAPVNSWAEEETGGSPAPGSGPSTSSRWKDLRQRFGKAVVLKKAREAAAELGEGYTPSRDSDLENLSDKVYEATASLLAEKQGQPAA